MRTSIDWTGRAWRAEIGGRPRFFRHWADAAAWRNMVLSAMGGGFEAAVTEADRTFHSEALQGAFDALEPNREAS